MKSPAGKIPARLFTLVPPGTSSEMGSGRLVAFRRGGFFLLAGRENENVHGDIQRSARLVAFNEGIRADRPFDVEPDARRDARGELFSAFTPNGRIGPFGSPLPVSFAEMARDGEVQDCAFVITVSHEFDGLDGADISDNNEFSHSGKLRRYEDSKESVSTVNSYQSAKVVGACPVRLHVA